MALEVAELLTCFPAEIAPVQSVVSDTVRISVLPSGAEFVQIKLLDVACRIVHDSERMILKGLSERGWLCGLSCVRLEVTTALV